MDARPFQLAASSREGFGTRSSCGLLLLRGIESSTELGGSLVHGATLGTLSPINVLASQPFVLICLLFSYTL